MTLKKDSNSRKFKILLKMSMLNGKTIHVLT